MLFRSKDLVRKGGARCVGVCQISARIFWGATSAHCHCALLTLNPEVLVLDEAVSALDVSVQAQVLNLLRDLQDEFGLSYVFISHDLAVVRFISDEVLVMKDGVVVEQNSAEQILASPREDYTRRLLAAIPRGYQPQARSA